MMNDEILIMNDDGGLLKRLGESVSVKLGTSKKRAKKERREHAEISFFLKIVDKRG
ncbi:MAG: hypothetical protein PVH61_44390 [Candidatus Aminicenantes bacterium]|jgi:hypothetical protein